MPENASREQREQELTMNVFTLSAGLVGVCLRGIGLLRLITNAIAWRHHNPTLHPFTYEITLIL
jgi:hypothetical protein